MANDAGELNDEEDEEPRRLTVSWEPTEVLAASILAAAGLLVVGGFASAIAATVGAQPSGPLDLQNIGTDIELGAGWAGPFFALFLIATLGLGWWNIRQWNGTTEDLDEDDVDTEVHLRRAERTVQWLQAVLAIDAAGAIAGFVGILMTVLPSSPVAIDWSRSIEVGTSALGTLLITGAGIWAGSRLRRETQPV